MPMTIVTPDLWQTAFAQNAYLLSIDGQSYWVQNANKGYSITSPAAGVIRFEVAGGDVWAQVDPSSKERSEIAGLTQFANKTAIELTYGFTVDPGAKNTSAWLVMGQFHQNDGVDSNSPPFAITMEGEKIAIRIGYTDASGKVVNTTLYTSSTDIVRGHQYDVKIQATFDTSSQGHLAVWLDGKQVANYWGPLGYSTQSSVYWKEGIYRAAAGEDIAIEYSNLHITTTDSVQKPAAAAPDITLTPILSQDTGASSSDRITSNGVVTVSGTTASAAVVTVMDGKTILGTTTASASGAWSFKTTLTEGSHTLSASATKDGLTGSVTATTPIIVDKTAPVAPLIQGLSHDTGIANDAITSVARQNFTGSGEVGSTIKVTLDGKVLGTTVVGADGRWSYDNTANALAQGNHSLYANSTDTAGNISPSTTAFYFTIDSVAPVLKVSNLSQVGDTTTIRGTAEGLGSVTIRDATTNTTASVASNTTWSISAVGASKAHSYEITAVDRAGNSTVSNLIVGTKGADTLSALKTNDTLWGGAGKDVFVLDGTKTAGVTLLDFTVGQDKISLVGFNQAHTSLTAVDSSHWTISDGSHSEMIVFTTGISLSTSDLLFA